MTTSLRLMEPNLFDLQSVGRGLSIGYSTSSIAGVPLLTVVRAGVTHAFSGDEIGVLDSPLGRLVTVTLSTIPDLESVTLTLVVPAMNVDQSGAPIRTFAVITTNRTSIGGPALVKGQLQTYQRVALTGRAQHVVF
jgi:hypothetical protein